MGTYLIGVDIGTQGTKAALFDAQDMSVVCTGFRESVLIQPKTGAVWQEADDIFGSVLGAVREVMDQSGVDSCEVAAIGIDSQMAGIMGVDEQGEAVTYYDSWLDSRCEEYVELMRKTAGREITSITGGPVTYTHGPKILWWKGEKPDIYRRIFKFVLPHGYVTGKLAGLTGDEIYFDYTGMQYSGFGDNKHLKWSEELLNEFQVSGDKMARIAAPFEIVGKLKKEYAGDMHLREGIPLVAGSGDTSASVFGAGVVERGQLMDCAGTASVLCSVVDEYVPDVEYKTMTMMRSPVDGLWMPLAYVNGGGQCLSWFVSEFAGHLENPYEELSKKACLLPPGSEDLLFIPHFAGRVLPNNPYVKGSFLGLDWKHTKNHMYRAIMEGIAYEYHYYLEVMKKLLPSNTFDSIRIMGGGARSELFNKIKADVLGLKTSVLDMEDTALVGSAVIAGVGAGVFKDYREPLEQAGRVKERIAPDAAAHAAYGRYADLYLEAIEAQTPVYRKWKSK
ncbi:xylulokinase [Diplocloster agilis]|uniref:Xylulose kinase n=1 Tax=Diplocloster agilis TaxID=2850323 RepID=A0A949NGF0_9FIRM|nr:FGGY family carbohydrate kinase [Diplocloster agilis]MBU9736398.1 hypothetical protein [Diplocloster agilis]